MRALSEVVSELNYKNLKEIKIWKGAISDEGVRALTKYIELTKKNSVTSFDVIDNQITPLGCEFLGKTLTIPQCSIKTLIIDHNFIGDLGLKKLTFGLRTNSTIRNLSMKYCGVGKEGMIYFQ